MSQKILKHSDNLIEIIENDKVIIRILKTEDNEEQCQQLLDSDEYEVQNYEGITEIPEEADDWTVSFIN